MPPRLVANKRNDVRERAKHGANLIPALDSRCDRSLGSSEIGQNGLVIRVGLFQERKRFAQRTFHVDSGELVEQPLLPGLGDLGQEFT